MLKIGCHLEEMEASALYKIRDEVFRLVGKSFDSRLATHYSFAIASALQVSVHFSTTFCINLGIVRVCLTQW